MENGIIKFILHTKSIVSDRKHSIYSNINFLRISVLTRNILAREIRINREQKCKTLLKVSTNIDEITEIYFHNYCAFHFEELDKVLYIMPPNLRDILKLYINGESIENIYHKHNYTPHDFIEINKYFKALKP